MCSHRRCVCVDTRLLLSEGFLSDASASDFCEYGVGWSEMSTNA